MVLVSVQLSTLVALGSEGLYVGKKLTGDTAKFSVLGATGNTSISGTLGVSGITSLTNSTNSTATNNGALVVTGGVGIGNELRVFGNTTLTADLAVNGGDLTSTASTFNLLASPTTVNIALLVQQLKLVLQLAPVQLEMQVQLLLVI